MQCGKVAEESHTELDLIFICAPHLSLHAISIHLRF